MNLQHLGLGPYQDRIAARLRAWEQQDVGRRLWARDVTIWSARPVPEIADRLGWLDLPAAMAHEAGEIAAFAASVRRDGMTSLVLLGMGGSSLAPDVFARTVGHADGWPPLHVLDSTHPAAVAAIERAVDPTRTLFVVSSKSGTTSETLSFFRYFWRLVQQRTTSPGAQFIAITDPGTPLERLARERSFRCVFSGPPEVGGRYSALSVFGLVPAALLGIDVGDLLAHARVMAAACAATVPPAANPALSLGAAIGELALAGRDKLTFLAPPSLDAVTAWIEQLIAESTGKDGMGIVPVAGEPLRDAAAYAGDRTFVVMREPRGRDAEIETLVPRLERVGHPVITIDLDSPMALGGEFLRWELATAAAGAVLGIHPFNQPDVQLAKNLAREAMSQRQAGRPDAAPPDGEVAPGQPGLGPAVNAWVAADRPGEYIAVHAYLAPTPGVAESLQRLRAAVGARCGLATTAGFGPRFLHSTGQLHKGGPSTGVFLQLVDKPTTDIPVPETDYTFGELVRAQALGDLHALRQRERRVLRVQLGADAEPGIGAVVDALLG